MPYPNLTSSVIVIPQTSGSSVGGQFAFVERQISGSNLILSTDSNGLLTGSTSISNLNVVNSLTSSNISSSGTISGSNGWFSNLTVNGVITASISGSISNAITSNSSSITDIPTAAGTYYVVFVDGSGSRPFFIDSSTLTWNPSTNTLSSSGVIVANNFTSSNDIQVGHNLVVSGSTILYGDLTLYGSGSVVNISSSTVIIGDNRITLNTFSPGGTSQRYAGLDLVDSGSTNNITSSLLWDSLNNYWLLTTNQTGSNPISSSAIILQGPTSSFGSEILLPTNVFLKVQTTTGNLTSSLLSESGSTLIYSGTITSSIVQTQTGSFVNLTIVTGSAPGNGTQVPAHPTASGMPGQIEVDNNFIYVYTSGIWKRVPLSVWTP